MLRSRPLLRLGAVPSRFVLQRAGTRTNSTHSSLGAYLRAPTTAILFLLGIASSELMYIIKLNNEKELFENRTSTRISTLNELIRRAEAGESVDITKEAPSAEEQNLSRTLEEILADIESTENTWVVSKTSQNAEAPEEAPEEVPEVPVTPEPTSTPEPTPAKPTPSKYL